MWDKVVIQFRLDPSRTLKSTGEGADHGGNGRVLFIPALRTEVACCSQRPDHREMAGTRTSRPDSLVLFLTHTPRVLASLSSWTIQVSSIDSTRPVQVVSCRIASAHRVIRAPTSVVLPTGRPERRGLRQLCHRGTAHGGGCSWQVSLAVLVRSPMVSHADGALS